MKNILLGAAALLTSFAIPTAASAQTAQEQLDEKYNLALAAGYKAMFLCSAIGNAESGGAVRSEQSVAKWELAGIQAPLDSLIGDLQHSLVRFESDGSLNYVTVDWADDMPPRVARHDEGLGCYNMPIGFNPARLSTDGGENVGDSAVPVSEALAPNSIGASGAMLLQAALANEYGEGSRTTALVVQQSGNRVLEGYAEDFGPNVPQRTWSVAKSIAATFVGAAVQSGEYETSDRVRMNYWRLRDEPRRAITIDNLLRMASGRYSDTAGNRTDPIYWGGATLDERAATWPMVSPPGTVFRYANNDTLMAVKAIEPFLNYYKTDDLFEKLGMNGTIAEADWQGNYILSSQVWSTARDLAVLGQLYLNNGEWEGERILPENWREYVSSPTGPQPEGRPFGYGAGFWLMNQSEGVPADTFAALGNRGQYIVIVPSRDVVIVRRGEDPVGSRFDIAGFTRDMLAALEE